MSFALRMAAGVIGVAAAAVILTQAERPPMDSIQRGYRGTAMDQIYNPRIVADELAANKIPASLPPLGNGGPKAGTIYKNVQVLNNVGVGEFTRLMASITTWVAPTQGCAYCHDVKDMASDSLYTKVVARRMIQMVQHVNADWKQHVADTGVTCFTCHRGQPVPANVWFDNPGPVQAGGFAQMPAGKNHPTAVAGGSSLPFDPFTPFLEHDEDIRVVSQTALPTTDHQSIKQTEWTYALMMNFSQSLGVNCTYCHNSRSFTDWDQSTPQRATAWYGIRMVRDLNTTYLDPLHGTFPTARLGVEGDSPKVNCATCHNGIYKPLFGVGMAKGFPELTAAH
ncbi:MAG TPA: photosynthetic reaction center cytochrome PufC [Acetobacteraceae bacterium]|nr:photosynthetic reaction center cytochrome PufC [Acetobacteraceae bacterium]